MHCLKLMLNFFSWKVFYGRKGFLNKVMIGLLFHLILLSFILFLFDKYILPEFLLELGIEERFWHLGYSGKVENTFLIIS